MPGARDIAGQRFGRLVAIRPAHRDKHGKWHWLCHCDCGKEVVVSSNAIIKGNTKSCGCYRSERVRQAPLTHGHTVNKVFSPTYRSWAAMMTRCLNPNVPHYKYYGGRGIEVCERWHSFENFLADMGPRPEGRYSIERVDRDGRYEPSNCKWIPQRDQSKNKRPGGYYKAKRDLDAPRLPTEGGNAGQ